MWGALIFCWGLFLWWRGQENPVVGEKKSKTFRIKILHILKIKGKGGIGDAQNPNGNVG